MSIDTVNTQFEVLDERFRGSTATSSSNGCTPAPQDRGPGVLPGRPLPGVERHPQRPAAALGRDHRRGRRLPRTPSGYANGNTVDRQGRLVTCEQGNRRVTRTEHDGTITVLADRYEGKRLNSPNDVVVRADGSIWFTDPSYGIDSDYEGNKARQRDRRPCHVYRLDPATGDVRVVADDFVPPQRPGLLPRRAAALHRRHPAGTQPHPRLRRHRRRHPDRRRDLRRVRRRPLRRRPPRRRRPGLGRRLGRRALLRPRRHPDRQAPAARVGRQPHLRRPKRNHLFITAGTSVYTLRVTFNGARYPGPDSTAVRS